MRTARLAPICFALVALVAVSAPITLAQAQPAPRSPVPAAVIVHHVPLGSTPAGEDCRVFADIEVADRLAEISLYYRMRGAPTYSEVYFHRAEEAGMRFVAVIPAAVLMPGVVEYFISSRLVGAPAQAPPLLHFASPEEPHPLIVVGDEEERWQRDLLSAHYYERSSLQLRFEWSDLGSRAGANGSQVSDNFWRAEGDYTYRILGWIYSIRLGAGVLRGNTWFHDAQSGQTVAIPDGQACDENPGSEHHYCAVGLTYGFAELRFRFGRYMRLDLKGILGAGPVHFDGGAGAQLVFGNALGSHFDLGAEVVSTVGGRGWLRLAWDTVPHLPMSFTLEVLNLPDGGDLAGRVFLTLDYRPSRHLALSALGGYGTRGWRLGGPVLGGAVMLEF